MRRIEESDLVQDLRILEVVVDGDEVFVDVYGGRRPVCGSVQFTYADESERRTRVAVLRRWEAEGVVVSLLAHGDTVALIDETARLRRSLDATDDTD